MGLLSDGLIFGLAYFKRIFYLLRVVLKLNATFKLLMNIVDHFL